VHVHRVWATRFGRGRLLRGPSTTSPFISARPRSLRLSRIPAPSSSPKPTAAPVGSLRFVARLRRAPLVNWTQDLFPEIAQSLAFLASRWSRLCCEGCATSRSSWRRRTLCWATAWPCACALRDCARQDRRHSQLVPVEMEPPSGHPSPTRCARNGISARSSWSGIRENFGARTILPRCSTLRRCCATCAMFTFSSLATRPASVGAGARGRLGLTDVSFRPYQPLDRLALSLSVPDLHLVSLKPELEDSSFQQILLGARGRSPVLFVGDPKAKLPGELRKPVAAGCFPSARPPNSRLRFENSRASRPRSPKWANAPAPSGLRASSASTRWRLGRSY